METTTTFFSDVTLLVTHYNRSLSLERLFESYKKLNIAFGDIVVSDDGSQPVHLEYIRALENKYAFRLITTPTNKGLGNNINKGQAAVKSPYTLYVQEDFVPADDFADHFKDALQMMEERKDLDIVRFYAYLKYPYLKPYKKGFYEMYIPAFALDYYKIYMYSDHPHLRRSNFLEKFGNYPEGIKGDRTEYRMCISFIQKKGRGLFYGDYQGLFFQKNSGDEPSTMTRSKLTNSNSFIIKTIRNIYRQFKYNFDILFLKTFTNRH